MNKSRYGVKLCCFDPFLIFRLSLAIFAKENGTEKADVIKKQDPTNVKLRSFGKTVMPTPIGIVCDG